jgi:hypothetical protein
MVRAVSRSRSRGLSPVKNRIPTAIFWTASTAPRKGAPIVTTRRTFGDFF